jgi:tetratricopeptide (TPR) repeat protein
MSDCHACECRGQATLVLDEDPARALELMAPVLREELTCGHEPALCISFEAVAAFEVGDMDRAAAAFRRGWHMVEKDPIFMSAVSRQVITLVRRGRVHRALDEVRSHMRWMDEVQAADDRMRFAAAAALTMRVAHERGVAPAQIAGRPTLEVADEFAVLATDIASTIDERNASGVQQVWLADVLDTTRIIAASSRNPARPVHAEPVVSAARRALDAWADLDVGGVDLVLSGCDVPVESVDPDELIAAAWLTWVASRRRTMDPTSAADQALAAAVHAQDPTLILAAQFECVLANEDTGRQMLETLADELAAINPMLGGAAWHGVADRLDDERAAVAACSRAADLYRAADRPVRAALMLVEAARRSEGERFAATLMAARAAFPADHHGLAFCDVLDAMSAFNNGDDAAGEELLVSAIARALPGAYRLQARHMLCDVYVRQGAFEQLLGAATDALHEVEATHAVSSRAIVKRHLGIALAETGRPVEGAECLEDALVDAERSAPELVGPSAWALGRTLATLADWGASRRAYARAARAFEADGMMAAVAHAQLRAGNAAWSNDDGDAADAHFALAMAHVDALDDVEEVVELRRACAARRMERGEIDEGLADLDAAMDGLDDLADMDDLQQDFGPSIASQGAALLADAGFPERAAARLDGLAERFDAINEHAVAVMRAGFLAAAGRLDEATALVEAHAPLLGREFTQVRGEAVARVATALDEAGRGDEADDLWERLH